MRRTFFLQICFISLSFANLYLLLLLPILTLISPIIADFCNIYDKIKNKHYILSAQQKLQRSKSKIIAITGSNGKTSVKNILAEMLKLKYTAVATPHSYNTPLGIAKFINNLEQMPEILVLEFGARQIGDIKNLCQLFPPDYGIITMVGNQHLQTFKSYKNIMLAKKELSDFLKENLCVFNLDNLGTNAMFRNKVGEKIGVSICKSNSNIYAENAEILDGQTLFNLHINNQKFSCKTHLLGEHNITNILLAFAMAKHLKISDNILIEQITKLFPTAHRLQLIKTHINILDDSYNCSLASAQSSLEVLRQFPGKKMVVTPGIIEGGKQEKHLNISLANLLIENDYVVIVGKHNRSSLLSGLRKMDNKKILFSPTLDEAKQYFKLLNNNDTLLLLNDLPDDYH